MQGGGYQNKHILQISGQKQRLKVLDIGGESFNFSRKTLIYFLPQIAHKITLKFKNQICKQAKLHVKRIWLTKYA